MESCEEQALHEAYSMLRQGMQQSAPSNTYLVCFPAGLVAASLHCTMQQYGAL